MIICINCIIKRYSRYINHSNGNIYYNYESFQFSFTSFQELINEIIEIWKQCVECDFEFPCQNVDDPRKYCYCCEEMNMKK